MRYRIKVCLFGIILVCLFVLIFVLNRLFPLYSDDYLYSFIYSSNPLSPIQTFGDILSSQFNHYMEWGGRSVVHTIAQLLLMLDVDLVDVINSLIYIVFIFCLYKLSNSKGRSFNFSLILFLVCISWLFLPSKFETLFWITGSANYLWGAVIVILFLLPYCSLYQTNHSFDSLAKMILMFFVGIIAGWTNENVFFSLVFFILGMLFLLRRAKLAIPIWSLCGLIGVCIGGGLMLASPGNFIRSDILETSLKLVEKGFLENIVYRVGKALYRYLVYILPLMLLYFILYKMYVKKTNKNTVNKKILYLSFLFIFSAHIGWSVMLVSPIFPPRATFGIISFIIVALGLLYADMDFTKNRRKVLNSLVIIALILLSSISYIFEYRQLYVISKIFKARETYLFSEQQNGNRDIVFDQTLNLPVTINMDDLSPNPQDKLNITYAAYFRVDSVRLILRIYK